MKTANTSPPKLPTVTQPITQLRERIPTEFKKPSGEPRGTFENWEIYWMMFWLICIAAIGVLKVFFGIDVFESLNSIYKK